MKVAFIEPQGLVINDYKQIVGGADDELNRLEKEGWQINFLSSLPAETKYNEVLQTLTELGVWSTQRRLILKPTESEAMENHNWRASVVVKTGTDQKVDQVLYVDPNTRNVEATIRRWQLLIGLNGLTIGDSLVD